MGPLLDLLPPSSVLSHASKGVREAPSQRSIVESSHSSLLLPLYLTHLTLTPTFSLWPQSRLLEIVTSWTEIALHLIQTPAQTTGQARAIPALLS